jgi:hypothetical protein
MRISGILMFFMFANSLSAQTTKSSGSTDNTIRLITLKKHLSATNKYVNFDVFKLMVGNGWVNNGKNENHFSTNFELQILYPYALLRNWRFIHIAVGMIMGNTSFAMEKKEFIFESGNLNRTYRHPSIFRSRQKSSHVGIVVMPFTQLGTYNQLEIMAGLGMRVNCLGSRVTQDYFYKVTELRTNDDISKITFPVMLQASYQVLKTASIGVYYSYEINKKFPDLPDFEVYQKTGGISIALKL